MGGLISAIMGMLGGAGGAGGAGGMMGGMMGGGGGMGAGAIDAMSPGASGFNLADVDPGGMKSGEAFKGAGIGSGSDSFSTGIAHGMSLGGGGGGGGHSHVTNTKDIDHQLGLSALQHYQDMSHPSQDFNGMNQGMQFAQMQKPGGPFAQPVQQTQPNAYVQALLQYMQGAR